VACTSPTWAPTRLSRLNPRPIYCSLSAFGSAGPWRDKPGIDALVQAMSGLMAITGEPDGGPALCGAPVVDTLGSLGRSGGSASAA
jgi:crotonobetainyl-CoA:carnitine CoA-transferase CaiB-like acyl-CoA transferase